MCKLIGSMATRTVALVILLLPAAPLCGQQLISSFEGDLSSSVGATWEGPGIPNSDIGPDGATDGTRALALHHPGGWGIQAILKGGLPLAQGAAAHDFLVMDVSTTDLGVGDDTWSPSWRQMFVIFNSNQGGWQQKQIDYPVAPDDGSTFTFPVVLDLNEVLSTQPNPVSVKANAQAFVSGGGQGTYFELFLAMQGGDQGPAAPVRYGDYAPDNVVTTADYVTWRKTFGGTTLPNETVSLGAVDAEDYTEWRAHYGDDYTHITTIIDNVRFANAGSGSGSLSQGAIPEPASFLMALAAGLALAARRRVRSTKVS